MLYRAGDLARLYHLNSSVSRQTVPETGEVERAVPPRRFPEAPQISLDGRTAEIPASLGTCLARRRSGRDFHLRPLELATLSTLLGAAAAGRTGGPEEIPPPGRPFPSAGGLYLVETYVLSQQVESLPDGLHHYDPWRHGLARLQEGPLLPAVAEACFGQTFLAQANLLFVFTARIERGLWKYGERAYRYALMEAGHLGQNLSLAATALNLPSVMVGGFYDGEVHRLLGFEAKEEPVIYLMAVGQNPLP